MQSRILSYFVIYLYFITQYIKITYTIRNITIRVIKNTLKVKKERNIMLKKIEEDIDNKEWKEKGYTTVDIRRDKLARLSRAEQARQFARIFEQYS